MNSHLPSQRLHIRLLHVANGEQNARKKRTVDLGEEVTVVLLAVDSAKQFSGMRGEGREGRSHAHLAVVSCRHIVKAVVQEAARKCVELDVPIAQNVRVRSVSLSITPCTMQYILVQL